MNDNINQSLLTFPCDFTIKVFGLASDEFESAVYGIIHKHVVNVSDRVMQSRLSENGKYQSLSIQIHVESKEQLDQIYRELSASPQVLMAI
ncbi:MAG: hypothetical protein ACD_46C00539G0005 [uncultured bacterium]|nr:MAG: hypothetical protein ACD_46C00539G0005 [uncultured bacterium]